LNLRGRKVVKMMRSIRVAVAIAFVVVGVFVGWSSNLSAETIQSPESFFGFRLGTDGEMATYPRVVEYLKHIAANSDRVLFEELGKTTMGNDYVLVKVSSPQNLSRLDRLIEITNRLADPRGLAEDEAKTLVDEGRPFYFLYGTIHSTEVGNGQSIPLIVYRLATEDSPEVREILDNCVLLVVPSQNPDGQVLVVDYWNKTKGTSYNRVYPDLYHKYAGHDDNRDWFMFTQIETRLNVEKVQNVYRPTVTHDMHQMGSMGPRIFVPPFLDPYDPNLHPLIAEEQAQLGLAMASALVSSGKSGVIYHAQYDLWAPARQYMVYHGQPRILTEIASVNLADPFHSPNGQPLGPQEALWNYPRPYAGTEWHLSQIMDYGETAVFAGLTHVAKYRQQWLRNFYQIHRDWVERKEAPYAFVVPRDQRDPYETEHLLELLDFGDVAIQRATSDFSAGGKSYPAGSWVIPLNQPYGAFAKTMLSIQEYPDLRYYPGGPPIPPYDVTGHTLGYLLGVDVDRIDEPLSVAGERVETVRPEPLPMPSRPRWAYVLPAETNASFLALNRLQEAKVPVYRAAAGLEVSGKKLAPGAFLVPPRGKAEQVLAELSRSSSLTVLGSDAAPSVEGYRLKEPTRIGLYKAANNMPAGWLMWLLEKYGFDHRVMSSLDFAADLSAKYDVIVLPSGTTKNRMLNGLSAKQYDESWRWAYGIGTSGWEALRRFVENGGTLVAIGSAVKTARDLLDLPLDAVLPEAPPRFGRPAETEEKPAVPAAEVETMFKEAFQSPASLIKAIEDRVVDPTSLFYCPGSLLKQDFDVSHPVAYGMPERWPVFFAFDQAYRVKPSFDVPSEVVAKYPDQEKQVASGWLLGDELLRDRANVVSFEVGKGRAVTIGSQVDFRAQTPATFKLLFNAMVDGPATKVGPSELSRLR
jgi:Zinc carboxypeptidase